MPDFHDRRTGNVQSINFYNAAGEFSHTADVRWLGPKGYRSGRPHGADLNKHMPAGGGWAVPEYDNNPNAPKQEK